MRYNVAGTDPETGKLVELALEAETVEQAMLAAKRRNVHVMSVSRVEFAEAEAAARSAASVGATDEPAECPRQMRNGRELRKLFTVVLVSSLFAAPLIPAASVIAGIGLSAVIGLYCFAGPTWPSLARLLGARRDRPIRTRARLTCLSFFAFLLMAVGAAGFDMQRAEREAGERRAAKESADAKHKSELRSKVRQILGQATTALEKGDIDAAEAAAILASNVASAPNRTHAIALLNKIKRATDERYALTRLISMPDAEFEKFQRDGQLVSALDLGFEALNARIVEVATRQLAAAQGERQRVAAEAETRRVEQERLADERREKARRDKKRRQAEKKTRARRLQSLVDTYIGSLQMADVSVVRRVSVKKIGDSILEATLTVGNTWHVRHKQIRLQDAQALWELWATIASPKEPDSARIKIVDLRGNEVGGSRILGGSLIWVDD